MTGRVVSHYEVLDQAGRGGMGVVYRARDLNLDRIVALKFLPPDQTGSETAQLRFQREARAIAALNHPNVATIYELGADGEGQQFLALEYLPGGTLKDKLAAATGPGGALSPEQTRHFGAQAARGLGCAHRNGIVHRDIKPSNLMFAADGTLKVTDFGLSFMPSLATLTSADAMVGTPLYMSPEQASGARVDARSDVFSLGAVMYEMLAGQAPFAAPSYAAVLARILKGDFVPIEQVRPGIPDDLAVVINKALSRDAGHRYEDGDDLAAALDGSAARAQLDPTVTIPAARSSKRNGLTWKIVVGCVVLLVAMAGIFWFLGGRSAGVSGERHIAVLPFVNVGGDSKNQAFCDGLAESLTSSLTEMEQFQGALRVVPSSEIRKQGIDSPSAARKAFAVNLVVTGSFQRSEREVRLTANLVDARTLRQIAARTARAEVGRTASFDEDVISCVADLLEVEIQQRQREALKKRSTTLSSAYEMQLEARGLLQRWDKAGNLDRSIELFKRAIASDSSYALAHGGLSSAYERKYAQTHDAQWLEQAQEEARRAIQIDPSLPSAHVTLGTVLTTTGKYREAAAEFQKALDADPVSIDALRSLAECHQASGDSKAAEETYQRAIQLQPNDWLSYTAAGSFYFSRGKLTRAEPLFERVCVLTPDSYLAHTNLADVYRALGKRREARAEYERALQMRPTSRAYIGFGALLFENRQYRESAKMFEKAVEVIARPSYTLLGNLAESYSLVPEARDKVVPTYERAIEVAERALAVNPKDALALSCRGLFRAQTGDLRQARRDSEQAKKLAPENFRTAINAAMVNELAGNRRASLSEIAFALDRGYPADAAAEAFRAPVFDRLREDPKFKTLIQSRGGSSPQ